MVTFILGSLPDTLNSSSRENERQASSHLELVEKRTNFSWGVRGFVIAALLTLGLHEYNNGKKQSGQTNTIQPSSTTPLLIYLNWLPQVNQLFRPGLLPGGRIALLAVACLWISLVSFTPRHV
jgi:hypothetical protein